VGDLKRVLTNVKTRGTWGEYQLENLLEQVLAPGQFDRNVATREGSGERVEFAVRLPGRGGVDDVVWLPVDAKFPQEDYQRLTEAAELGDAAGVRAAGDALEVRVRGSAKDISTKYLNPPRTTDFGLLFLPTEGLYAEIARRPGLLDSIQHDHRVLVAGPTTLLALLNSLQMGFRTLAIEKRSSEVWRILGAFKTEFEKFNDVLVKARAKLQQVDGELDKAITTRTNKINSKLRAVQALPDHDAVAMLSDAAPETDDVADEA
jgi:DNA recombination protein RmuC